MDEENCSRRRICQSNHVKGKCPGNRILVEAPQKLDSGEPLKVHGSAWCAQVKIDFGFIMFLTMMNLDPSKLQYENNRLNCLNTELYLALKFPF